MAIADHKLGKHYFHVLAEANKMVVSAMPHFCLCWSELKQSVVDKAIDQWRPMPSAHIHVKGQYFEQLLNWNVAFSCWILGLQILFFRWLTFSHV